MDRLRRFLAGGMLALMMGTVVTSAGCRSTKNEVPPGPKYSSTGDPMASGGFNSAPHPYNGMPSAYGNNGMPGGGGMSGPGALPGDSTMGASNPSSSFGTPTPGGPNMAQPTNNAYGGPGTSGLSATGH